MDKCFKNIEKNEKAPRQRKKMRVKTKKLE